MEDLRIKARKFVSDWLWEGINRKTSGMPWERAYIEDTEQMIADFATQQCGQSRADKIGADRLAYACARQVVANRIGSRSAIGDALLDYLRVGHVGGPQSVPEWMAEYEKKEGE